MANDAEESAAAIGNGSSGEGSSEEGSLPIVDTQAAPTPLPQLPAFAPTPGAVAASEALTRSLESSARSVAQAQLLFVDCNAEPCTARLQSGTLEQLHALLQTVEAQVGRFSYTARERLDAYAGRSYQADLTIGGTAVATLPATAAELIE